jgi:transposase
LNLSSCCVNCEIGENGYNRDNRPERQQILIGVVTSFEGYPIKLRFSKREDRSQTFPKVTNKTVMQKKYFNMIGIRNPNFHYLIIVCDLVFGAWNFHEIHRRVTLFITSLKTWIFGPGFFTPSNYLFK